MESVIPQIIAAIPSSAIPLVFVVIACWFIYWKINNERKVTKSDRDTAQDELDKRLTLVEHDVKFMKDQNALFADKLDRILDELTEIKVSLATKQDKK